MLPEQGGMASSAGAGGGTEACALHGYDTPIVVGSVARVGTKPGAALPAPQSSRKARR